MIKITTMIPCVEASEKPKGLKKAQERKATTMVEDIRFCYNFLNLVFYAPYSGAVIGTSSGLQIFFEALDMFSISSNKILVHSLTNSLPSLTDCVVKTLRCTTQAQSNFRREAAIKNVPPKGLTLAQFLCLV